ncbi:DUF349 domain-containing protein [Marinobacter sp. CHS3-4]|uniref:DUF349 domain-containing protein n=1 Tax=Marinobacter sp. CHS3-4 TaxID=3045174 RepID=UPI0024B53828|nr:DUF349 domain-containing protein [Marinobacter sp. CHS3-4]MDI9245170.1 DUF349 domain-containing protein [Marinobacter sp. CHS3-4]
MAAFIQKLFNRKKTAPEKQPSSPVEPTVNQQEKVERQEELRQQQLATLGGNPSQGELETLAVKGATADIRLSAAKALTDKDTLQRVQKQSKGSDKGVYQTVRQALQAIREQESEELRREEAITSLIRNARDQARSEDTKLFEPRLDSLLKQWSELEAHASQVQASEFLQAAHDCKARLEAIKEDKAKQAQAAEQKNQRAETLALLEDTVNELKQASPDVEPSLSSLDALQKTQENRWLEATRDTDVGKQEQKTYESLMLPLRAYISALRRLNQNREAIQLLLGEEETTEQATQGETPSAKELIDAIDWPSGFPTPPLVQQLAQKAGQKPRRQPEQADSDEQKGLAEALSQTLTELEKTLEAQQLKESKQLFKTAQQQVKKLDRRHAQPLQPRIQLLGGQLRELTDWQGFATRPKQEALCEQMEYLKDQPMEPEAKAERIKEIQNEWRELGGSSDRELWNRFKQASDLAFEPCKEYFSAKSGLKQANLETRKAIVEQLRTFLDNADWQAIDWKGAERIHQKAREEWKAAWPIEFRENRPVQKDFDALLKRLEQPLNEERQKNEALKQAIVERAEALVDHEPLTEAMNQAKNLQGEWQQIGITRHREDRKLWQAFRKACDQIFARRDAQKNEQQEQARAADEQANAILERTSQEDENQQSAVLKEQLDALKGVENTPLSKPVQDQVRQEKARLQSLIQAQRARQQLDEWKKQLRQRVNGPLSESDLPEHWGKLAANLTDADAAELAIRAEILAETSSPEDEQALRMEVQVQRLANGLGGNGSEQTGLAQMESLVAAWCLRPEDESLTETRAERMADALEAATHRAYD